jgi:hypothetical protein
MPDFSTALEVVLGVGDGAHWVLRGRNGGIPTGRIDMSNSRLSGTHSDWIIRSGGARGAVVFLDRDGGSPAGEYRTQRLRGGGTMVVGDKRLRVRRRWGGFGGVCVFDSRRRVVAIKRAPLTRDPSSPILFVETHLDDYDEDAAPLVALAACWLELSSQAPPGGPGGAQLTR